jgi:hypothetical protein
MSTRRLGSDAYDSGNVKNKKALGSMIIGAKGVRVPDLDHQYVLANVPARANPDEDIHQVCLWP